MLNQFLRDPVANSIAVITLIFMLASVIWVTIRFIDGDPNKAKTWPSWVIPVLSLFGLVIAIYLTFIESTQSEAFCGPVGDCNSVQQSQYAKIFGFFPVGLLGGLGYLAILILSMIQNRLLVEKRKFYSLSIWGLAWFGVLFSIYLTFLEPFVIGATCMWCITSAFTITFIFLASTPPAIHAMHSSDDVPFEELVEE